MNNEAKYWKSEYDRKCRKDKIIIDNLNIKIIKMQQEQADMCEITMKLFKLLGVKETDVLKAYELEKRLNAAL